MHYLGMHYRHPLGGLLAKFELAAVISPVLVADKAKSGILTYYLTLTWLVTCFSFFFNFLSNYLLRFQLPPRPPRYGHWFMS